MNYSTNYWKTKIVGCAAALLLSFSSVSAETIEFVVSASAGGPNDTVTRKIVEKLEKSSGLQFIVSNKPGAAHTIAYTYISNSNKPTLLVSTSEITNHEVYSQLEDVHTAGYFYNILFVSANSKVRTFKEFVETAKTREIIFGHSGIGTFSNQAMEHVCVAPIKCLKVPYKSGSDGMLAIMSGQIDTYALPSYGAQQFLDNNKLVAIHNVKLPREKSWVKLFSKNLSHKDKETISNILKQDVNFFANLGFEK